MIIEQKTVNTLPAVYFTPSFGGQWVFPSIQFEPYQKPREYPASIEKKTSPVLNPEITANLTSPFPDYLRAFLYALDSKFYPFNVLTVFIEDKACSAFPPASE